MQNVWRWRINHNQNRYIRLVFIIVVLLSVICPLGLYQKNIITINGLTIIRPSVYQFSANTLEDTDSYWNLFKGIFGVKYSFNLEDNQAVSINFENFYLNNKTSLIFMKEKVHFINNYDLKDKLIFKECILEKENNNSNVTFEVVGRHKVENILFTIIGNNKQQLNDFKNQICTKSYSFHLSRGGMHK